jgi:DNA polymerase-3 subunit alpha
MRAERDRFIDGAGAKGYSRSDAESVFDLIEPFAGYAFNKAHAVCYGTISYQTAFLKANYPAEYMTAVLRLAPSHPSGAAARVAAAVAECAKLGIVVLPPDINRSRVQFEVELLESGARAIRFGLAIIKNVGESAVQAIVDARDQLADGTFTSLEHLCEVVDHAVLNRRVLESLIKCGACDSFGERAPLLAALDRSMAVGHTRQQAARRGQMDMFGFGAVDPPQPTLLAASNVAPIPRKELLAWEKDLLGTYLSAHPLSDVYQIARSRHEVFTPISELTDELMGQAVRLLGCVAGVRKMTTKANRTMAVVTLEDLAGNVEVVLFPEKYDRLGNLLADDAIVLVKGRVDLRNDLLQLIAEDVSVWETPPEQPTIELRWVLVDVACTGDAVRDAERIERLAGLFKLFNGDDGLLVAFDRPEGQRQLLRSGLRIDWCDDLRRALVEHGMSNWAFVEFAGREAPVA